jgi:amino acid permease
MRKHRLLLALHLRVPLTSFGSALNVLAVKFYGEAEFWLSGGKVLLMVILFCFTFITMVGGNPKHVRIFQSIEYDIS